jgi:S-DNA-T family DNA segregation ATPase FtsK/SpoIIIE
VAGSTGGGKSICLLTLISSLIFQKNPKELKLMLIDPKRVELTVFNNIPHLICPVITDSYKASEALDKILNEIEKRYQILEKKQVNNIKKYNEIVPEEEKLPFIVVVVDELADLILIHKQKVEQKIVRIGQIARAVGIFMILATQRPSNDVITGLIKTNVPARIAFNMTNHNDSRTILNSSGAEKLLGKGDLLFKKSGETIKRIQGT